MLNYFPIAINSLTRIFLIILLAVNISIAQTPVHVDIDLTKPVKPVSPLIYGKNNVLPNAFLSSKDNLSIAKDREAGVRFVRQGGGNNSTKYNWRKKISSHPDWYNNVYDNDWSAAAKSMLDKLPSVQGMWTFQLLGKAASNKSNNFNDWAYNGSKYWDGVHQNLAGGGQVNPDGGSNALIEGNPDLYLIDWTADSTVAILDKWFGMNGLGYDQSKFLYWNMDNEPEIWEGTHDDVMSRQCTADEFMQRYFKVAKAARAKFPDIKLVGPVPANEWQWYNYSGGSKIGNQSYCWLEYFIKRIADEEKASGIKLLDVIDIHFYPGTSDPAQSLQLHRVFYDRSYVFPEANGVHTVNGGWNTSINKEYILGRCSDWLIKYLGPNHGVGLGVTEMDIKSADANVQAIWYASTMGEFMKNGAEMLTPWSWKTGMWEALHLFSRYNQENYVQATSADETMVSAYPTIDANNDSMSVVLINRSMTEKKLVTLNFNGFMPNPGSCPMYTLSKLGTAETFVSHTKNALVKTEVEFSVNQITIELAPMSVNTILLKALQMAVNPDMKKNSFKASIYPNPATNQVNLDFLLPERSHLKIDLYRVNGQLIKTIGNDFFESGNHSTSFDLNSISGGIYWIKLITEKDSQTLKLIKN